MATITPNPATLQRNQTQQFTVSGITSPVWTLEGIGTLNQSGLYTAPNSTGSALIRVHSPFWNSVNASFLTRNANDTLTTLSNSGYYAQAYSNALFNAVGDWVEFSPVVTGPYWTGLENGSHSIVFYSNELRTYHASGNNIISGMLIGPANKVRMEIVTGGFVEVRIDGALVHTTAFSYLAKNLRFMVDGAAGAGLTHKVPKVSASVSGYTEVQSSVSIQIAIEEFLSKDPLVQYVPKNNLQAWFAANKSITDSGLMLPDLSMNSRHVAASTNLPAIQNNKLNGFPALYWDGTKNPLTYLGNLTMRHLFIVCAYDGATFANYQGIISGATEPILEGHIGQTKFFDNTYAIYGDFRFYKSFVSFPESNQQAKMSGAFAIYEIQYPTGLNLTGINIGQDRNISIGRWKGWFCESMIYSEVLNDLLREKIYYYLALKYQLWRQNSDDLNIFPFYANKTRTAQRKKEAYLSEPYDGDLKALVRGNYKRGFELPFNLRPQEEFLAAENFHSQHFPLQKFIFRDTRFYPARDSVVRLNSDFNESGSDVTFRFNYSFNVTEA